MGATRAMRFRKADEYNKDSGSWWLTSINTGPIDIVIKVEGDEKLAEHVAKQIEGNIIVEDRKILGVRDPKTKEELQAYYAHLCETIEREAVEHMGTCDEIRADIRRLKVYMLDLGMDVPPFCDQVMEMWRSSWRER